MATREKLKEMALATIARDLESAIALYTNISPDLLEAISEALDKAFTAGVRAARAN